VLALDLSCAVCEFEKANPGRRLHQAHTCGSQQTNPRKGPVGKCVRKGGGGWYFPADTTFMEKKAVPKALGRPDKRGDHLLKTTQKHYKDTKGVYETTDAEGNIVYWAHEGSL